MTTRKCEDKRCSDVPVNASAVDNEQVIISFFFIHLLFTFVEMFRQQIQSITNDNTSFSDTNRITLSLSFKESNAQNGYFGKFIGEFPATAVHNVKGKVYAPTEDTLYIKGFHYDGAGPDAFFWAGSATEVPTANGFIIPDELGR